MAHTAPQTARILTDLYAKTFQNDFREPFRITWPQLRSIAGIAKLDDHYLNKLGIKLNQSGYFLIPMDNFLVVTQEGDLSHLRAVPDRIVEGYIPEEDDEDIDVDDPEVTDFESELDDTDDSESDEEPE